MQHLYDSEISLEFNVPGVTIDYQNEEKTIELIEMENAFGKVKVSALGASVVSYVPVNGCEMIWVSESAIWDGTKPVRGGVPVCWPWFGQSVNEGWPAHGFVRNAVWQIDEIYENSAGEHVLIMSIESDEMTLDTFPYEFLLELKVVLGEKLQISLITTNTGSEAFEFTEALHTYFAVGNANAIEVSGLEGSTHSDKLTDLPDQFLSAPLVVYPPMDSVFLNHSGEARIQDAGNHRQIVIEKENSASSIVWNPGFENSQPFVDMKNDAWPNMLCVESGNVLENAVTIQASEQHALTVLLSQQPI